MRCSLERVGIRDVYKDYVASPDANSPPPECWFLVGISTDEKIQTCFLTSS